MLIVPEIYQNIYLVSCSSLFLFYLGLRWNFVWFDKSDDRSDIFLLLYQMKDLIVNVLLGLIW